MQGTAGVSEGVRPYRPPGTFRRHPTYELRPFQRPKRGGQRRWADPGETLLNGSEPHGAILA